jgi:hypothetical protein
MTWDSRKEGLQIIGVLHEGEHEREVHSRPQLIELAKVALASGEVKLIPHLPILEFDANMHWKTVNKRIESFVRPALSIRDLLWSEAGNVDPIPTLVFRVNKREAIGRRVCSRARDLEFARNSSTKFGE